MKIKEITCRTALSASKLPGLDYTLNPYLGCMHQCMYCYAPGILHLKRKEWESIVGVKRNLPLVLSKELKQKKPGTIGLSTVTDPYQPVEKKYSITRYCLKQIVTSDFPVCIQTKSDLILRDMDIIDKCKQVEVMVSIGTLNDSHRMIFEPGSSPIDNRLTILRKFAEMNVKTSVFFGPIYPTVTKEQIPGIIDVFLSCGVDEIMVDSLHLKQDIIPLLSDKMKDMNEFSHILPLHEKTKLKNHFSLIHKTIYEYVKDKSIHVTDAFS